VKPEHEVERLRRYQRILLSLGRLLTEDREPQEFLEHVVGEVSRATEIARVKILRYRPDHGDLLVIAGVGWAEGVIGVATLPIDISSPPGRAIQTGQPTVIEDLVNDEEYRLSGLLKEHDIRALVNVPVFVEGTCWGVLEVDTTQPQTFTQDTSQFLEAVAQLIAARIRRAERRQAAVQVRAEIAAEAQRRKMLLREMQHRVKNNFQLLVGMLLRHRKGASNETKQVLQTLSDRVMAIALAHDQLDPDRGLESVNLGRYLAALCRTFEGMTPGVTVATTLDDADVPIEMAISGGLIVNELVTNALKHAFNGPGTVYVELRADVGRGEATLSVRDDGKGMKKEARNTSSGLSLIQLLAAQINGTVEQESSAHGTAVRVNFSLRPYVKAGSRVAVSGGEHLS
jgi:two-component system, sensor histidine kinase PdtaS